MFLLSIIILGVLIYAICKVEKWVFKILLLIPTLVLGIYTIIVGGLILLIFLEAGGI